jgi:hypothetical protein
VKAEEIDPEFETPFLNPLGQLLRGGLGKKSFCTLDYLFVRSIYFFVATFTRTTLFFD